MESLVRQQYDRLAERYDQRWRGYVTNTLSFLVEWARVLPSERVLDVACGTGELEHQLIRRCPQQAIVGVDFSDKMLAIARRKFQDSGRVRFRAASATALPWQRPIFNVVLCANAFHYFDEPAIALLEMRRVLQPQGRVIILDWCRDYWVCQVCDWLLTWLDPAHKQCYSEAELHGLLTVAGYRIRRSQRVRFGLIWGLMVAEAVVDPPFNPTI